MMQSSSRVLELSFSRTLQTMEAALAEIDKLGAPEAGAYLDSAINALRREMIARGFISEMDQS